jgi:hypothetical protein
LPGGAINAAPAAARDLRNVRRSLIGFTFRQVLDA